MRASMDGKGKGIHYASPFLEWSVQYIRTSRNAKVWYGLWVLMMPNLDAVTFTLDYQWKICDNMISCCCEKGIAIMRDGYIDPIIILKGLIQP